MKKQSLKFKWGTALKKDEVWIDMMRLHKTIHNKLRQLFGDIPSPLPRGCLTVKFYIYKKKPSWIECNGKRIEFTYWMNKSVGYKGYYLIFDSIDKPVIGNIVYKPGEQPWIISIPVKENCYPKKQLIKYLLNELVTI